VARGLQRHYYAKIGANDGVMEKKKKKKKGGKEGKRKKKKSFRFLHHGPLHVAITTPVHKRDRGRGEGKGEKRKRGGEGGKEGEKREVLIHRRSVPRISARTRLSTKGNEEKRKKGKEENKRGGQKRISFIEFISLVSQVFLELRVAPPRDRIK